MSKTGVKAGNPAKRDCETIKAGLTLEEKLERLETLGENIRRPDIPLDKALKDFEEGIKLAQSLEKELEKIQNRIEILMNGPHAKPEESPELELFDNQD